MPALVERRIAPGRVGLDRVLLEAVPQILRVALENDPHPLADVVGHGRAVRVERRGDLDHALVVKAAAFGLRAHDVGEVLGPANREGEALRGHVEAGGVGYGGRLDRGLRAVEERVEHLRIEAAPRGLLGGHAPMVPDGFRRRLAELGQPLMATAGGRHVEAAGARPVDEIARQGRLVAVGHRINDASLARLGGQRRADEGVRLDRDVDDILGVAKGLQNVGDRRRRRPGALDDDVDGRMGDQRPPIVTDVCGAALGGSVEGRGRIALLGPAHEAHVGLGVFRGKIGDTDEVDTRQAAGLGQEHRAELAGPDHAHAYGIVFFRALRELGEQVHRHFHPAVEGSDQGFLLSASAEVSTRKSGPP